MSASSMLTKARRCSSSTSRANAASRRSTKGWKRYEKLKDKGLVVLGFPCDQFGHQEPGDEAEIKNFCSLNYDVKFPLFAKVDVNGANTHPLYKYLKKEAKGLLGSESIKWNFTKFLVDKNGKVVARYAPTDTPEKIEKDVAAVL